MNNWLFILALFAVAGIMCLFGIMYALFGILGYFQRCESRIYPDEWSEHEWSDDE